MFCIIRSLKRVGCMATAVVFAVVISVMSGTSSGYAYTEQFGIYGTKWADWTKLNPHLVGFHVYQSRLRMKAENYKEISDITSKGVEVIAMQQFHPSHRERFMREDSKPDRPIEEVAQVFEEHFSEPSMRPINAVTLDEENFWWNGRGEYLSELYYAVKSRVGGRQVWQWFNDNPRRWRAPLEQRFRIPADGYMLDMYSVPVDQHEAMIRQYTSQGKPVVSVLWASTTIYHGGRHKGRQTEWWENTGWRDLYARTLINRRNGVRSAFFMYDIPYQAPGNQLSPSWQSADPCVRAFVKKFFTVTLPRLGTIPTDSPVPATRPDWVAEQCPAN